MSWGNIERSLYVREVKCIYTYKILMSLLRWAFTYLMNIFCISSVILRHWKNLNLLGTKYKFMSNILSLISELYVCRYTKDEMCAS